MNTKAAVKLSGAMIAIIIIACAVGAYMLWQGGYITTEPEESEEPEVETPEGQVVSPSDLTSVNKPIKIVGVDELAGGVLDGTTDAIDVYDSDGKTVLEADLDLSSGSVNTAASYPTGKQLYIQYYYDTTIDAYMWWKITVPQMSKADAESLTTNQITLKTREAGAYTDSLITSAGVTLTDGSTLNVTATANQTGTATYTFYTTSDNTGYPAFYDPVYAVQMDPIVWVTLTGTGYETVSLTGFDGGFEKGSTMYYYKKIPVSDISKQKVGNNYVLPGSGSISFGWNAVGHSAANTTIIQVYLKIYSNVDYMKTYGDYGPYDFTGAEQTVTLYTYT